MEPINISTWIYRNVYKKDKKLKAIIRKMKIKKIFNL
jgi:hypothetical protein